MTTTTPTSSGGNSGGVIFLVIAALAAVAYFVFLRSHTPAAEELTGEWTCDGKPWTIRFAEGGTVQMKTIGPAQAGTYQLEADGDLKLIMVDGKRFQAKAAIRIGKLTLTDPDGSSSSFKRVEPPTLPLPTPTPVPTPTRTPIHGRWVSTNYAEEVLELSLQGDVKISTRGQATSTTGRYQFNGNVLRYTLDWHGRAKEVECKVTSLTAGEMTLVLPGVDKVLPARSMTYWRIDMTGYSPLRTKLIGAWQKRGPERVEVKFADDDTIRVTSKDQQVFGIFRVVGQTLEYRTTAAKSPPIARMTLSSVTATTHTLSNPADENERWEYVRVK